MSSSQQEPGTVGDVTLFTAVDRTNDPGFFTRFLDEANEVAQTVKPPISNAFARSSSSTSCCSAATWLRSRTKD
jgi:hypothetical protein